MVKPLGSFLFLALAVLPAIVLGDDELSSIQTEEFTGWPDTDTPSLAPTAGEDEDEGISIAPPIPRGLAYINSTLTFEFDDGVPPNQEDIKGIIKATEDFYFSELNNHSRPHRRETDIKMYSIKPRYEYETQEGYQSEWRPARFYMTFMVKISEMWYKEDYDERSFKQIAVETLRHANYTSYIHEYAHKAEPLAQNRCGPESGLRCGGPPQSQSQFRFTQHVHYERERMIPYPYEER